MSNVAINISAEYTGKKAFSQAEKSVKTLEKSVKKLAGGLGIAFGVTAITAFGKAAAKAFAADEAAAVRLSNAVDNLGISFANPAIAKFVSDLERSAGVSDDILRPSFQALLTTTGSLTQSQILLSKAITISRGKGVDLATVSQDLANGYVGITKGLKKYNTGLTQAELKSKSFSEILAILLKQSAGAAGAYMDTTAFKFDVLGVATDNLKEKIGMGLVDAMARIGGGTETKDATSAMDLFGDALYETEVRIGTIIGAVPSLLKMLKNLPKDIFQGFVGARGGITPFKPTPPKTPVPTKTQQQKILEKLEKDALKRAKDLAAAQAKLTAEQKKQAALKKAGTVFDIEQANLLAALNRDISEQDKIRVQAQLALLNNNEAVATSLTKKILMAQDETGKLYKYWQEIPDARNPFAYLDEWIKQFQVKLNKMQIPAFGTTGALGNPNFETGTTAQIVAELDKSTAYILQLAKETDALVASIASSSASNPAALTALKNINTGSGKHIVENFGGYGSSVAAGSVIVQIDGKTIATATQSQSLSGNPSSVSRLAGMFAG